MRCDRSNARAGTIAIAVTALAILASCRQEAPLRRTDAPASAQPAAGQAAGTVPHGDHNPHHGGVVMMKGDLHYEVVVDPLGKSHRLYFTDAIREDLPATIASNVALTIHRAPDRDERVAMAIDDAGESWIGHGEPVAVAGQKTVGVSFTLQGEPYTIELPLTPAPSR